MWIAETSFQSAVPKLASAADYSKVSLSPEEGFVLSRIDGAATIDEIVLICGLPKDQALSALTKLHDAGLIQVPGAPTPKAEAKASCKTVEALLQHETQYSACRYHSPDSHCPAGMRVGWSGLFAAGAGDAGCMASAADEGPR